MLLVLPDLTGAPWLGTPLVRCSGERTAVAGVLAPSDVQQPHWLVYTAGRARELVRVVVTGDECREIALVVRPGVSTRTIAPRGSMKGRQKWRKSRARTDNADAGYGSAADVC